MSDSTMVKGTVRNKRTRTLEEDEKLIDALMKLHASGETDSNAYGFGTGEETAEEGGRQSTTSMNKKAKNNERSVQQSGVHAMKSMNTEDKSEEPNTDKELSQKENEVVKKITKKTVSVRTNPRYVNKRSSGGNRKGDNSSGVVGKMDCGKSESRRGKKQTIDGSDFKETTSSPRRKRRKDNGKLGVKEEVEGLVNRVMKVRTSPKPLYNAMKSLSDEQKKILWDIGFGPITNFGVDSIPSRLGYFVVDNFNPENMQIQLKKGVIDVTKCSVFDVLGVPIGGKILSSLKVIKDDDDDLRIWRQQFEKKEVTAVEVMKKIMFSKEADWLFIMNFLVLFANTMGETQTRGKCDLRILKYFNRETSLTGIDWCEYILECAKRSKKGWSRENLNSFFAGPITFLTLLYVDNTKCKGLYVERSRPICCSWNCEHLKAREGAGGYMLVELEDKYMKPLEEVEEDINDNVQKQKGEPSTSKQALKKGYLERMEVLFGKVVVETKEIHEISKKAIAEHPGNKHFKEWNKKINLLDVVVKELSDNLLGEKDRESERLM